ncbi:hypothetical protein HDU92_005393 [Lobulomyces angularis]|nr:hypothetical protein HDU92_005393 [Lobulomyces angularis]
MAKKKVNPNLKNKKCILPTTQQNFTLPEVNLILPNYCLVLKFPNLHSLKAALFRAHKNFENGELRGPLKGVNFSYLYLFGFVFSISIPKLTEEELMVWNLIESFKNVSYIIAGLKSDQKTFLHEWAHCIYHQNESYKNLSKKIYDNLEKPLLIQVEKELILRNYKKDNFIDEFQAYLIESPLEFGKKNYNLLLEHHKSLKKCLGVIPTF